MNVHTSTVAELGTRPISAHEHDDEPLDTHARRDVQVRARLGVGERCTRGRDPPTLAVNLDNSYRPKKRAKTFPDHHNHGPLFLYIRMAL